MNAPATRPADVLIVDDTPANLQLLSGMLLGQGHKVRPVPSGKLALKAAALVTPDLILLDINMPDMNGFEVCERLKRDPHLAKVPVIFVTALTDVTDKVRGLRLGAVDFITKPFQFEEVEARVETHLELSRLRRELAEQVRLLEERVAQRTRELAEAHARLAKLDRAKHDFLCLISHEVRTPLNGVLGVADLLVENCQDPAAAGFAAIYRQSRQRLMTLIDDALLLSHIGAGGDAGVEQQSLLDDVLEQARRRVSGLAESREVQLALPAGRLGMVQGAKEILVRAFQSLLETALKLTRPHTLLRAQATVAATETRLVVEVEGATIPEDLLPQFFDVLAVAQPIVAEGDLGLAPALAERILAICGGGVTAENLRPAGVRFTARLKRIGDGQGSGPG
jgi:two-component system sensor histidine kinase/response regulator